MNTELTIEQKAMLGLLYTSQAAEALDVTDLKDYRDDLAATIARIEARLEDAAPGA